MSKRKPKPEPTEWFVPMRVERAITVTVTATSAEQARAEAEAANWTDEQDGETVNWKVTGTPERNE